MSRDKCYIKSILEDIPLVGSPKERREAYNWIVEIMTALKKEGRIHYFNVIDCSEKKSFFEDCEGFVIEWAECSRYLGMYNPMTDSIVHKLFLIRRGVVVDNIKDAVSNKSIDRNERKGVLF